MIIRRFKKWTCAVCLSFIVSAFWLVGQLLIFTKNTNALKHSYDSLFIPNYTYGSLTTNQYYYNSYPTSGAVSHPTLSSQNLLCGNNSYSSLVGSSGSTLTGSYSSFTFNFGPSASSDCFYGGSSWWYSYSSIQIAASNSSDMSRRAAIDDIFGEDSQTMYVFALPLTVNHDTVGSFSQGRKLQFHGEFSSLEPFSYTSRAYPEISISGISSDLSQVYSYSYSWKTAGNNSDSYCTSLVSSPDLKSLSFDCYVTLPYSFSRYTTIGVIFHPHSWYSSPFSPEIDSLWSNSKPVYLWDWYIITDEDSTPGASASIPISGNDIQSSPSYDSTSGDSSDLFDLFDFNILNPFQPVFGLFIDSSSCYNIPIIAGFLHVDDPQHFQYCPWFPSSVRQVLTPVFGLSASMLLFGFIVKWLKSSSGNFEADSSGGDK